ncbi:MAG TPA: SPOR domain-containing protein [Gammaproteobacteria bacterium]
MARRSRRSNPSGLPHLVVGLALGLAVAAGVYFSDLRSGAGVPVAERTTRPESARPVPAAARTQPAASRPAADATRSTAGPAAGTQSAATSSARTDAARPSGNAARSSAETANGTEPTFDFYEILPQYEVPVPEETGTVARRSTPAAPAEPVAEPGSYVLQTGSFRSHADADRMQASLALLGVESRIQKVAIDSGEFHRVRIGPISNLDELNRIRTVLRQAGIDSLMMKVD